MTSTEGRLDRVKIVTDSTACLPPQLSVEHDIKVVPLRVCFGEQCYSDGVGISNEEFYQRLKESKAVVKTSRPSPEEFRQVYAALAQEGYSVLSLHISSKLSGTIQSALAAKRELPEARIEVVDTSLTAMALGMVVLSAAHAAEEGQPLDQIKRSTEDLLKKVELLFTVDTLEYLRRGKWIGGASALMGKLLGTKPVWHLRDGRIDRLYNTRDKAKAEERMLELMEERIQSNTPIQVAILHAQAFEEARDLEKRIRAQFNCREVFFTELGPGLGGHVGPGAVGVAFYSSAALGTIPAVQKWQPGTIAAPA